MFYRQEQCRPEEGFAGRRIVLSTRAFLKVVATVGAASEAYLGGLGAYLGGLEEVLQAGALFCRQGHSWRLLQQLGRPQKLIWAAWVPIWAAWKPGRPVGASCWGGPGRPAGVAGRPGKAVWGPRKPAWGLGSLSGRPGRSGRPFWASWEPGQAESA